MTVIVLSLFEVEVSALSCCRLVKVETTRGVRDARQGMTLAGARDEP
jgi:hypothetical protein